MRGAARWSPTGKRRGVGRVESRGRGGGGGRGGPRGASRSCCRREEWSWVGPGAIPRFNSGHLKGPGGTPRRGVGWPPISIPLHAARPPHFQSTFSIPCLPTSSLLPPPSLSRPRLRSFPFLPPSATQLTGRHDGGGRGLCRGGRGRGGGHHLLAPRGRPRRVDAALEGDRAAVIRGHGEGGRDGLAGGGAGEAHAVLALRLHGQQGQVGPRQPRVPARLQRRVWLRRVRQRRRGRRLLLAGRDGRTRSRARRGHPHRRPSVFLPGQGGLCRRSTAPVDPARPAAPHRRPEVAEEDEAPGGEAAGDVPVGRERRPSPGDGVAAEGLHGAVQGERQTGDKAGAFFLLQQAEEDRVTRGGAGTNEAAASRWRLRAPRPQLSGAGCRRRTSGGSLTAPDRNPVHLRWWRLTANLISLLTVYV